MIEVNLTLLFIVFALVFGLIAILFLSITNLKKQLKMMSGHINERVSEFSFELEQDQRRDLDKRVELLYDHFGLYIRVQPSQKIESLKD